MERKKGGSVQMKYEVDAMSETCLTPLLNAMLTSSISKVALGIVSSTVIISSLGSRIFCSSSSTIKDPEHSVHPSAIEIGSLQYRMPFSYSRSSISLPSSSLVPSGCFPLIMPQKKALEVRLYKLFLTSHITPENLP